jgi:hypothetical protein
MRRIDLRPTPHSTVSMLKSLRVVAERAVGRGSATGCPPAARCLGFIRGIGSEVSSRPAGSLVDNKRRLDEREQALAESHRPGAPISGLRRKAHHAHVM